MKSRTFNYHQLAFSLIELMSVVLILAVLMAIGYPAYKNYITKTKIMEGLSVVDPYKLMVEKYVAFNGSLPTNYNATSTLFSSGSAGPIAMTNNPLTNNIDHISFYYSSSPTPTTSLLIYFATNANLGGASGGIMALNATITNTTTPWVTWKCASSSLSSVVLTPYLPNTCK
ncbi:MAG: prepilin-type N-terminal cleavage/methylation protein [Francisellaceae bacterium]|nr:prepilin-type N-terminal cleavage/methylation protein [Francisellaceae bacterium]